jgi:hypothetical protein
MASAIRFHIKQLNAKFEHQNRKKKNQVAEAVNQDV